MQICCLCACRFSTVFVVFPMFPSTWRQSNHIYTACVSSALLGFWRWAHAFGPVLISSRDLLPMDGTLLLLATLNFFTRAYPGIVKALLTSNTNLRPILQQDCDILPTPSGPSQFLLRLT